MLAIDTIIEQKIQYKHTEHGTFMLGSSLMSTPTDL